MAAASQRNVSMMHNILVSTEIVILLGILVPLMLRAMRRHRKRVATSLPELLCKLEPLSRVGLEAVAGDMLEPTPDKMDLRSEVRLDRTMTWNLIGGLEGLRIMKNNADVLIEVAFYLQQWSTEAIEVTGHLRLSAQDIRREIRELKRALRRNAGDVMIPLHVQRVAGAYYLMTCRVISLVEISNSAVLPQLRDVL